MMFSDVVPMREMSVEMCEAGAFDRVIGGHVHSKTCPFTILAQAVSGWYAIRCGDGRHAELAPGEAFLTGANLPLRIVHHGDPRHGLRMQARWLHMHFTLFGAVDVTSLLVLPLRVGAKDCAPFGEVMAALLALPTAGAGTLAAMAHRQELAFRTLRLLCSLAPLRRDSVELLRQRDRLIPVLALMRNRLAEKVTVVDLARRASLSVPRFHVFFRRFMGRSPMDHLKHLRLAEACRLLATGDEPLRAVAERTGFCSEFHLGREFRTMFGVSPGAWRRAYDGGMCLSPGASGHGDVGAVFPAARG